MARGKAANPLRMTKKQREIMETVCEGNKNETGATESWCDVDQVIERISWTPTKPAFACSIRYLIKKGLLKRGRREIRRTKRRAVLVPTELGYTVTRPVMKPLKFMEDENGIIETF